MRSRFGELVEDVEVPLIRDLSDNSRLLEQVVGDVRTHRLTLGVEFQLQVLSESRRVVVAQGLCVTKRLEQRVGGQNHVLGLLNGGITATGYTGNVLHDPLGSFRLSGTRFSRDNNTLVVLVCVHVIVGGFGHSEDMGRDFETVLIPVGFEDLISVDTHCELSVKEFDIVRMEQLTYSLERG